ncbi:MAG: hypothetical protein NPIRA05_05790 [Nitrospirales bacterium]|nr:MAG: hypothetical protein NPIRA05_05790 [Nitrospirales bacterium]
MIDLFLTIFGTAVVLILSFIAPILLLTGELFLGILSLGYYRPQQKGSSHLRVGLSVVRSSMNALSEAAFLTFSSA